MSTSSSSRRPDGRRVIASSPRELELLRLRYENGEEQVPVELVEGSAEHADYLRQSRQHHESLRQELRRRHCPHYDEWEEVHDQLSSVTTQLARLSTRASALSGNFDRFGYDARLRAYDGGDGPAEPVKLFRKPVMKQWFHRGLLWRGSKPTEIRALEIFFDLVYAGIIHNGVRMTAEPTARMLLRFAITFLMSWKIWSDVTLCLSWFETDDVWTRLEVLFEIACLLAFTTNIYHCFDKDPTENTYLQLVSFYLAARLFATVAYMLPAVKGVMVATVVEILVPSALWIASVNMHMPTRLALIWPALFLDMYAHMFSIGIIRFSRHRGRDTEFYPAMNIEHRVERKMAFVSLVSGYSVVGILFQSAGGYVVNAFLGKAILGMIQAYIFNWIYFDVDSRGVKLHAIRRSTGTAFVWQFAHLVVIMGYVVSTSALSALVLASDVPNADAKQLAKAYQTILVPHLATGSRFFHCHGLAVALFFMGFISLTHEHRQPADMRRRKRYRVANRLAVCLILFLLPLAHSLRSLDLISISLGLSAWVLIFELWGKSCKGQSFIGD